MRFLEIILAPDVGRHASWRDVREISEEEEKTIFSTTPLNACNNDRPGILPCQFP
jgi:hypothetical protein